MVGGEVLITGSRSYFNSLIGIVRGYQMVTLIGVLGVIVVGHREI